MRSSTQERSPASVSSGAIFSNNDRSCFNTGVNLHAATINSVVIFYRSGSTAQVTASLIRHRFANGGATDFIAVKTFNESSGTPKAGQVPVMAATAKIDNLRYSYGFGICMGLDDFFLNARITYSYDNAGD